MPTVGSSRPRSCSEGLGHERGPFTAAVRVTMSKLRKKLGRPIRSAPCRGRATRCDTVWSIGARTALAFAAAAMALTVGALVFVNVASQWVLGGEVVGSRTSATTAPGTGSARPMVVTDGRAARAPAPSVQGRRFDQVERVAAQQWQWSAVAVGGVGLAAGGVGWLVSRRMLRPIDRITETTTRISASTLHERSTSPVRTTNSVACPGPWTSCSIGWKRPSRASARSSHRRRTNSGRRGCPARGAADRVDRGCRCGRRRIGPG